MNHESIRFHRLFPAIAKAMALGAVACALACTASVPEEPEIGSSALTAGFMPYFTVCTDGNGHLSFTGDNFHREDAVVSFDATGFPSNPAPLTWSDACGNASVSMVVPASLAGGVASAVSYDAYGNVSQTATVQWKAAVGCYLSDARASSYPMQCTGGGGGGTGGGGKPCGGKVCLQ